MEPNDIVIGMAGSGGDGVVSAGEILVSAGASEGVHAFMLKSFGPQIRGGESSCRVRLSGNQIQSHGDLVQVLGIFSWSDYKRFRGEMHLSNPVVIVMDTADKTSKDDIPIDKEIDRVIYEVPITDLAKEEAGTLQAKNMVMLGVLSELFGLPDEGLRNAIRKKFKKKDQEVIDSNLKAMEAGATYVRDEIEKTDDVKFSFTPAEPKVLMEGNEAFAYGALYAGCRFFAGYPITPSSEIMEWMSRELPKYNGTMLQSEDELAAIGMVIGAAFAGEKAMTATSGAGISLMSEQIGLASMAELPLVIMNVQRTGPSTGIPTKTEQADLQQALYGTHGDANRVVIAPADVEDCFDVAVQAFYISEKYQIPVIVLSDQYLGQRKETFDQDALFQSDNGFMKTIKREVPTGEDLEDYKRFKFTESGVSPMSYPGIEKGMYQAAGLEHSEYGLPTSDVDMHAKMTEKRFRKNKVIAEELNFVRFYGPEDAEVGIIGWGSSKGAIKEAVQRLNEEGFPVSAAVPQILMPFPQEKLEKYLEPLNTVYVAEMSYSGQFYKYLKGFLRFGDRELKQYARSGAAPFDVNEIYNTVKQEFE